MPLKSLGLIPGQKRPLVSFEDLNFGEKNRGVHTRVIAF